MALTIDQLIQNLTEGYKKFDTSATNLGQIRDDLNSQVQNNLQDWIGTAPQDFYDTKTKITTFTDDTIKACNDTSAAIKDYITALQTAKDKQAGPPNWVSMPAGKTTLVVQSTGPGSTTPSAAGQQVLNDLQTAENNMKQAFDTITSAAKSVPELSKYVENVSDIKGLDDVAKDSKSGNTSKDGDKTDGKGTGGGASDGGAPSGNSAGGGPPDTGSRGGRRIT